MAALALASSGGRAVLRLVAHLVVLLLLLSQLLPAMSALPSLYRSALLAAVSAGTGIHAVTVAEINGNQFLSPYQGQPVSGVLGVVTAKSASGLFIRGVHDVTDAAVSNGLYVYSAALGKNASISVGDRLNLSGTVTEYRSNAAYLYTTELESPVVNSIVAAAATTNSSSTPQPLVIGVDTLAPPTEQFTRLDDGDVFGVPNNQSQISTANPQLDPQAYGLDFWESLSSELVTIPDPVAISKPNSYGDVWVMGSWSTTGKNARGGLTLRDKDANPESIIIGTPLDGTKNSDTYKIGDTFANITGIVHYQYGFYYLLPLTALEHVSSASPDLPPPTTLTGNGTCSSITVGDYNIENFAPNDTAHVQAVAAHIVTYLRSPDILFIQEVQDSSGPTDDGTVDANKTLSTLTAAIAAAGGIEYAFVDIAPENDKDGGQPGGNIRQAYLYNAAVVRLHGSGTPGDAQSANAVLAGPTLQYNPGRIDPGNAVFDDSRKPLAAEWAVVDDGSVFFTVNVHWGSKGGSSSLQGDPRPPVNAPVDKRTQQANITAAFIAEILAADAEAAVIFAGDCNEFAVVQPMQTFASVSGMKDLDEAAGIEDTERYTYTYGGNMEELDHIYVSPSIAGKAPREEHIHVNTWVSYDDQTSDHDPTVAKLNLCHA